MNRNIMAAATLATAAMGMAASPTLAAQQNESGEAELAKLLEGREAGTPVSCIPSTQIRQTHVIDKTALVYRVGNTLYVNRPSQADALDGDDILVTRQHTGQLCRPDSVELRDRSTFFYDGFVVLQDFVPYRKVKTGN
ncbi:hypothetical protein [Novosphingobium sp. M1R2S20]|uniref:Uncharacterized protein n=1 Tax=Novosphingobium rhizovicinum TaxID=3228928 RepID=A0ABV3RA38_9SPHN